MDRTARPALRVPPLATDTALARGLAAHHQSLGFVLHRTLIMQRRSKLVQALASVDAEHRGRLARTELVTALRALAG
jgi:hypothetical protein